MIGIDEVGRGAWAGPLLVVAARAQTPLPLGLADSKVLKKVQREALYNDIILTCDLGEGWVEPTEIDTLGLSEAMRLAVKRALANIDANPDETIIMDGKLNFCEPRFLQVECVIGADSLHPIVSAASIYAKVTRDRLMTALAKDFPGYGFESHVGYGTAAHIAALQQLGISKLHRLSYKPVRALLA